MNAFIHSFIQCIIHRPFIKLFIRSLWRVPYTSKYNKNLQMSTPLINNGQPTLIIIIIKGHSLRRACLQPATNTQNSQPRPPTMNAKSKAKLQNKIKHCSKLSQLYIQPNIQPNIGGLFAGLFGPYICHANCATIGCHEEGWVSCIPRR